MECFYGSIVNRRYSLDSYLCWPYIQDMAEFDIEAVERQRERQAKGLTAVMDLSGNQFIPLELLEIVRAVQEVDLPNEEAMALGLAYKALCNRLRSPFLVEAGGPSSWEEVMAIIDVPIEPAELTGDETP